jgi:hypothetical protein
VRGNTHAGFGGRIGETHREQSRQGAPVRPDHDLPAGLHLPRRRRRLQRQHDADSGLDAGLVPVTVPELLRLLRDIVIPPPWRDRAHRLYWSAWRRHQHRARQAHQRWNAYAERIPLVKGGD